MIRSTSRRLAIAAICSLAACARGKPGIARPAPVDTAHRATRDTTTVTDTSQRTKAPLAQLPVPAVPESAAPPRKAESHRKCVLDFQNTPETRAQVIEADPITHKRVTFVGGGVSGRCVGQDITVVSDSAELYDNNQFYILIGNVHYQEPTLIIDAQRVTYYRNEERLLFENSVRAQQRDGSGLMTGSRAEYFRAVPGVRAASRLVAGARPNLMYVEKDSLGKPLPPAVLVANTLIAVGDTAYHAVGDVVLTRTDLVARGDSAFVQSTRHYARLLRRPVIESKGDQPFTLRGRVIDLYGAAKELDRVVALDSAKAVSKDLTVVSDTIDLRVARNHLERAFAFGRSGATATTAERTVIADSLDILMPGQRVRELHAIGRAYIESDPDTTRVKSDERDWLKGDTIIAHFDSLASNDTTSRARLESVLATGNASSLYQVPPNRQTSPRPSSVSEKPSTAAPKQQPPAGKAAEPKPTLANKPAIPDTRERPGINYVRGRVIHLQFIKGEVDSVTVVDNASGLYLEPESDSAAAARRRTMKPATPRSPVTPPIRRPPTRSP